MADQIITQEYLHQIFEYKDGDLYWKINKGQRGSIGKIAGSIRKDGYLEIKINRKIYLTHRLIYLYFYGFLPQYIDHIDGDIANNIIENLREASLKQNSMNRKLNKNNVSGSKNVNWDAKSKKWRVRIIGNNKRINLGVFKDLELADLIAHEARDKYHGQFAKHK